MKRFKTTLATLACAAGLAMGLAAVAPAHAAGPAAAMSEARTALVPLVGSANVVEAQYRDRRYSDRHWRGPRHRDRRHYRSGPGFFFHFGTPAPRYAPPPRRTHRLPAAHVRWCHNRYRSYRAWDNSFQPYHGPRRQCRSPYF